MSLKKGGGDDVGYKPGFNGHSLVTYMVAQGKPTLQSSTAGEVCLHEDLCHDKTQNYYGSSGRAVDGNTQNSTSDGSCTHTKVETNPWWRVDLKQMLVVTSVRAWGCGDCEDMEAPNPNPNPEAKPLIQYGRRMKSGLGTELPGMIKAKCSVEYDNLYLGINH